MSILPNGRNGKLVLPAIPADSNQRDIARIYAAAGFPVHPWIRTRTKISARGKRRDGTGSEFHFNGPEVIETSDDIDLWADKWQVGFACSWMTGLVALDVDDPIAFLEWDIEFPETLTVSSGRMGGYHLYLDFRHLREAVSLDEWPVQGDIPGGTIKTAGFTGAPGSIHPNNKPYRVVSGPVVARGSLELLRALAKYRNTRVRRETGSGEPGYLAELWKQAFAAEANHQYPAVRNLINALQKEMSTEAITGLMFPVILSRLESFDQRDPWDERGLREMLGADRMYVTVEEERDLAAIRVMEPKLAGEEGEEWFWNSREELSRLRQWAQAQMVSPWALLGEVLTEVIARVPPTFVLPDIVGGYGSLNIMFAVTGGSSAGKGGASAILEQALIIDEPEINFMKPVRWGVGSGEGLVKNYAYRSAKEGQIRTAWTSIVASQEVKTLNAIVSRASETLTGELNKFYMGEALGFGYGDPTKRLDIPRYSYRGVLIVGAQPEHSGIIVTDDGSGLSRRWMLLNAVDRFPPDARPGKPEPVKWSMPRGIYELDHDAERPLEVMEVCDVARAEIVEARDVAYRGKSDGLQGHRLFTQEKFAAGLAILAMRTDLTEEDWRLAAYAMDRSDDLRYMCKNALRKRTFAAARVEGQIQGVKEVASEEMKGHETNRKLWQLILRHIPANGRVNRGALNKAMPQRKDELPAALKDMVSAKVLAVETDRYNGRDVVYYSRVRIG